MAANRVKNVSEESKKEAVKTFDLPEKVSQVTSEQFGTKVTDTGLWQIVLKGSGKLPSVLTGKFTHHAQAMEAITRYVEEANG